MDYLAKAREAARRWRESQEAEALAHLSSLSSVPSTLPGVEGVQKGKVEEKRVGGDNVGNGGKVGEETPSLLSPLSLQREEPAAPARARYASAWPDSLPGLGARWVGPFTTCAGCLRRGTWVRYGADPICLTCARRLEGGDDNRQEQEDAS